MRQISRPLVFFSQRLHNAALRHPQLPRFQYTKYSDPIRMNFHTSSPNRKCNSTKINVPSSCHKSSPSSSSSSSPPPPPPSLSSPPFWSSPPTWKRASLNTFRCLIGCTAGDFSAMWYLQSFHPDLGMQIIMGTSMLAGITTSLLLETVLLRMGRDQMRWSIAAKTAAGMSMISMITMEIAENAVDYYLTGGVVQFESPAFWGAAVVSVVVGFLAPLPYNYVRLRRYGRACH